MRPKKLFTLVFVQNGEKILLGYKKRGFGVGKWNGFGGKVEPGESITKAAKRELFEECGLETTNLSYVGVMTYIFPHIPEDMVVHVFRTYEYTGELRESDEMIPKWFDTDKLPFENMWIDDPYWFPSLLAGESFNGEFFFDTFEKIERYKLTKLSDPVCPDTTL